MTKKNISIALLVLMVLSNVYLVFRVNSNNVTIASYNSGLSQRNGVGQMESYWTKYIGASKNSSLSYEDRANAEADSTYSIIALFVLDAIFIGTLYKLNKKAKPVEVPLTREQEWEREKQAMRRRRR
ncbi:MAG: hypothetical protein IKZ53_08005 [Selenomonadaceae bacterium]|nr:hypothetical protein [Selenomonadaceae bacterium]